MRTSLEVQGRINAHARAGDAKQTFTGRDLATYIGLDKTVDSKNERKEVPFLIDEIARFLGVTIEISEDEVSIPTACGGAPSWMTSIWRKSRPPNEAHQARNVEGSENEDQDQRSCRYPGRRPLRRPLRRHGVTPKVA